MSNSSDGIGWRDATELPDRPVRLLHDAPMSCPLGPCPPHGRLSKMPTTPMGSGNCQKATTLSVHHTCPHMAFHDDATPDLNIPFRIAQHFCSPPQLLPYTPRTAIGANLQLHAPASRAIFASAEFNLIPTIPRHGTHKLCLVPSLLPLLSHFIIGYSHTFCPLKLIAKRTYVCASFHPAPRRTKETFHSRTFRRAESRPFAAFPVPHSSCNREQTSKGIRAGVGIYATDWSSGPSIPLYPQHYSAHCAIYRVQSTSTLGIGRTSRDSRKSHITHTPDQTYNAHVPHTDAQTTPSAGPLPRSVAPRTCLDGTGSYIGEASIDFSRHHSKAYAS